MQTTYYNVYIGGISGQQFLGTGFHDRRIAHYAGRPLMGCLGSKRIGLLVVKPKAKPCATSA